MSTKMVIMIAVFVAAVAGITAALTYTHRHREQSWAKWTFRSLVTAVVLVVLLVLAYKRPDPFFDANNVPKLVTANVVDVKDIYQISKYRSGAGHDYSGNGETCRSMKHYINVYHGNDPSSSVRSQPTAGHPNIVIHAPFDGVVLSVSDSHLGEQVDLIPWSNIMWTLRLDHMDIAAGLHAGSFIKSGQTIGSIGPSDPVDVSLSAGTLDFGGGYGNLVSYFQAMSDQTFAPWAKLGYQRDDFIVSKAYRDAHPLQCSSDPNSDAFVHGQGYDQRPDWVYLRPDPFGSPPSFLKPHYGPPVDTLMSN